MKKIKIYKFWAPNMQWGNFSTTQVNMKKKKVEFLLPPETNIDWGGDKI